MTVRKVRSAVKTGKAVWWVSLISVWLQPSWLPALLASLASAGWLLWPHLILLTHTQTATHFALLLMSMYRLIYKVFLPSLTRGYTHAPSQELFPLCGPTGSTHPAFFFPSDFSSRAPRPFHRKAICEAFNRSVPVCLSWMGAQKCDRKHELEKRKTVGIHSTVWQIWISVLF